MTVQMSPKIVPLYRVIVAEGRRFPKLARLYYESGPGPVAERLAEVLEKHRRAGEIAVADCRQAADLFVGMIRGNQHLQVVLGLRRPPDRKEAEALVQAKVDIFLEGVRARI